MKKLEILMILTLTIMTPVSSIFSSEDTITTPKELAVSIVTQEKVADTEPLTSEDFTKLFHKIRFATYQSMQQAAQNLYVLMNMTGTAIKDASDNLYQSIQKFIDEKKSHKLNQTDNNVAIQERREYYTEPNYVTTQTPIYSEEYVPVYGGYLPEPIVSGYTTTTTPESGEYYRR